MHQDDAGGLLSPRDSFLAVILCVTLLIASGYVVDGWSKARAISIAGIAILVATAAQQKKMVFAIAIVLIAIRMAVAVFLVSSSGHALLLLAGAFVLGGVGWRLGSESTGR